MNVFVDVIITKYNAAESLTYSDPSSFSISNLRRLSMVGLCLPYFDNPHYKCAYYTDI